MFADLTLYNAKIYTVDAQRPFAEAVACRNGRILAVGSNAEMLSLAGPDTRRIDAGGRLVLPGFIDSHVHFLQVAIRARQVSLFGVADFDLVRRRVAAAAAAAPPGQWVLGWGWDENLWDVAPHAALLDAVAPDVPVALARMDMHTWWVNSAALRAAGVSAATADPPESQIERDAAGHPTGILREWNAIALVEPHIPPPDERLLRRWLLEAQAEAHRLGLTGIHDQRVEREGAQSFRLWQALRRDGALKLRVHMNLAADFLNEAAALGLQPGFGDERLWVGHLKAFADGTMGSRTAWMLDPFENEPHNRGIAVTPAQELAEIAMRAAHAGFPLSVHAIGDQAVREVLDVLAEWPAPAPAAGQAARPHRIEHVQLIHPDDLPRLAQHNIFAAMQPVHLQTDWPTADKVWGARARYAYAFRSLLNHGAQLAFGSDAPVAPLNPWLGVYAAVTRQDNAGGPSGGWYAPEKLSVAEAIHGYTLGPARLAGKAHRQGSITPGKWADLIVLDQDLFSVDPEALAETAVVLTIMGGEVVYE